MDLERKDPRTRKFLTNVGLITTDGKWGPNICAAEWTHHLSYGPSLIAVTLDEEDATSENIMQTREFGINIASETQNWLSSMAGNTTGKEFDKISALKELGVEFYPGSKIKAPMLKAAAMNAECKLFKTLSLGDHTTFVGEVVEISAEETIRPIVYHDGKYWKIGEQIEKPDQAFLDRMRSVLGKYQKQGL
jgi:flavin reductase (DIM6/NTAB) family NADH-FMN oxidoreductase RutF